MNKCYARISEGALAQGYCIDEVSFESTENMYPQDTFIEVSLLVSPETHYVSDGVVLEKPNKPGDGYYWYGTSNTWVDPRSTVERLAAQWVAVRQQRNQLLGQSDWTQLPDVPLPTKDTWAVYRQALRDVTLQPDPFSIVWPTAPE
jgi:hypothetical protein